MEGVQLIPGRVNVIDTKVIAGKVHAAAIAPIVDDYTTACEPVSDGPWRNFVVTGAPVTCGVCQRILRGGWTMTAIQAIDDIHHVGN